MTTWKRIALALVFADFTALTAYAVYRHGIAELFALCLANVATTTLFVDLTIALSLILLWMRDDARAHGRRWLPYGLLTLGFGSVGPLLYLLLGGRERAAARIGSPVAGRAAA